jgi:hypothetical protein
VNVWETVLVFVVAPLGGFGLLALLVFGTSVSRAPRYRPGRPWEYDPVWYVPRPDVSVPVSSEAGRAAIASAANRWALPARDGSPAAVLDVPAPTARGGANGQW